MLPKERPPTHPGEILRLEFLNPMGISQTEFAKHLDWPYARLKEIINGKRGVTADSALAFSEALTTSPEFWLNLQRNWEIWHVKRTYIQSVSKHGNSECHINILPILQIVILFIFIMTL